MRVHYTYMEASMLAIVLAATLYMIKNYNEYF